MIEIEIDPPEVLDSVEVMIDKRDMMAKLGAQD